MFTGLIEETAEVKERTDHSLVIARPTTFDDLHMGSSIAVSGACLTVSSLNDVLMGFDVHEETWKRTKLGDLKKGDRVNLERALKIGERFEGHIVQGHVDSVGIVRSLRASESAVADERVEKRFSTPRTALPSSSLEENTGCAIGETYLTIHYPPTLHNLIVEKGSIAVDGVSLTVASLNDQTFTVALIPETLKRTTLGKLKEGSTVNLEADVIGKYART